MSDKDQFSSLGTHDIGESPTKVYLGTYQMYRNATLKIGEPR